MKQKNLLKVVVLIIIVISALQGCKLKDDLDKLTFRDWKPDLAIPIVNSTITVREMFEKFEDDSIVREDPDGLVILVYRGRIFSNEGDQVFVIPDIPVNNSVITLPDLSSSRSLGQIANAISDPEKTAIISANGTNSNLPAIPAQGIGSFSISGNGQSNSFAFESGGLVMNIENNFPFDITNLNISLVDSGSGAIVASFSFILIPAGQTRSSTTDLTGKTISPSMQISIPSISSAATSSPVFVDTSAQMVITFEGQDLVFEVAKDTIQLPLTNGENLDHLSIKSGSLDYSGTSTIGGNTKAIIDFVNATGPAIEFGINAPGSSPMGGTDFDFTGAGLPANALIASLKMDGTGEVIPFYGGQSFSPSVSIKNIGINYVDGYLGKQSFNLTSDTVNILIYANLYTGAVSFLEPSIELFIHNSYGFPITSKFSTFEAYNQNTKTTMGVTTPFDSLMFNYPTMAEIGEFATTTTLIDNSNSNILNVMDLPASEIRYLLEVSSNSSGDTDLMNFILDTSHFDVDVEVQLPLKGRIAGLEIQDTLNLEAGVLENGDYANFVVITENRFPVDIQLQVYFLDENDVMLDSLFSGPTQLFASGVIDAQGGVVSPTRKVTNIPFGGAKYERAKRTSKIIVRGIFTSSNNGAPVVKIYTDNFFNLKIGVEARVNPNL